uniref:Acyl_transf_3 domain-containing protein n=1 Tax=Steinernema glaseri TaxID=37863 RepID=A0A1I7YFS3_9BILA
MLETMHHLLPTTVESSATLLLGWTLLVLFASFLPLPGLGLLSLKQSWTELTSARDSRLSFLDVFRVVAILWVMVNHTGSEGRVDILEQRPSAEAFKISVSLCQQKHPSPLVAVNSSSCDWDQQMFPGSCPVIRLAVPNAFALTILPIDLTVVPDNDRLF